jgi:predicted RNA binding protein YcfA (HicA-like mRNA interferase family)
VYAALLRIGWQLKRQSGSHRTLSRNGWPDFVFAFHDGDEIGPKMLARIAKHTGLAPEDMYARAAQPYGQPDAPAHAFSFPNIGAARRLP